jgi:transcriptional regulator with XRE-family HTH domain
MMNNRKQLLGARIKELRKAIGLSQDSLSEKIGIESKYLSRIEVGKCYPSMEVIEHIADALQVEMLELFNFRHFEKDSSTPSRIENLMQNASADELQLINKIIHAILR